MLALSQGDPGGRGLVLGDHVEGLVRAGVGRGGRGVAVRAAARLARRLPALLVAAGVVVELAAGA